MQPNGSVHATDQIWFFLKENMKDAEYSQNHLTLDAVRRLELSRQECLKQSKTKGLPESYAFYLHSESMAAAVRLLSDESITATYNLYCSNDPVVTIIIRKANEPSPNSSQTPSHADSLASRKAISANRKLKLPELFKQPTVRHSSGSTDMSTFETMEDEDDMVSILEGNEVLTFHKDYLKGTSCS